MSKKEKKDIDYLTLTRRVKDLRIIKTTFLIVGPVAIAIGIFSMIATFAISAENPGPTAETDLSFLLAFSITFLIIGGLMLSLALTAIRKKLRKLEKELEMEHQ